MHGSEPHTVKVHLGDPMILDCRTTRPDIKISLLINQKQVSRLQYKFDPRVGVIVEDLKGFPNQTQIKEITLLTNNYSPYDILTFKPEIHYETVNTESQYIRYLVGEDCLNAHVLNEKYKPLSSGLSKY
ncbi:hypothetical protein Avbf_17397 [Armadillidium vulgare]|nr:hypothetical protein Avbf_17397 [Armadillidium vulgare]